MAKAHAEVAVSVGNTKRSKAAADGDAPVKDTAAPKAEGDKGAPRPRKWNYGIANENTVQIVARTEEEGEPKLKAGESEGYAMAAKGCTVEGFLAGSDRGILRRLSRKGLVNVVGTDGTVYPIEYVAPPKPEPKPKKAEAEEAGETKAA